MVRTGVYTLLYASLPWWEQGIYPGYMPLYHGENRVYGYIPLLPWWVLYTLVYIHPIPPWVHPAPTRQCTDVIIACRVQRAVAWAQDGNNPWVRASQRPQDLKSVIVLRPLCAELLRLSRE